MGATGDEHDQTEHRFQQELKPRSYARSGNKGRPRRGEIWIGPAERRLEKSQKDPQSPYITGRYQNLAAMQGGAGTPMHLHINQAGRFIKCLLVVLQKSAAPSRRVRLSGTLEGAGFSIKTEDAQLGTVEVAGKNLSLTVEALELDAEQFQLVTARPSFFDDSLAPFMAAGADLGATRQQLGELRDRELAPLTRAQLRAIDQGFALEKIKPHLDHFDAYGSRTGAADQLRRQTAIEGGNRLFGEPGLEDLVAEVLDPRRWPREQLALARERARWVLSGHQVLHGNSMQSALDQIQSDVAEVLAVKPDLNIPNLRALLGWPNDGVAPQLYTYTVTLELKYKEVQIVGWSFGGNGGFLKRLFKDFGASVNGGLYYGTLTVKTGDETPGLGGWQHNYNIVLLGTHLVAGKGKRESLSAEGKVSTPSKWGVMEFNGWAKVLDGSAWAGVEVPVVKKTVGKSVRDAVLIIHGTENHPRLEVPLKFKDEALAGVGVEGSMMFGRIESPETNVWDESTLPQHVRYEVRTHDQRSSHFLLGSAVVHGRDGIRRFCANWLPWLMSPLSTVEIFGYADNVGYSDRQDEPERNKELSTMRAENVLTAIKDILGEHLAVKTIKPVGLGDTFAREHDPPRTEDRMHRRVDVVLNGRCVFVILVA